MNGRSLKASPRGIEQAKQALTRNSLNQAALARELGLSRSTITNFFRLIGVDRLNFEEICIRLGLDWQEIVDIPASEPETEQLQQTTSKNADFVGREEAIAHLENLVSKGAKVIGIYGKGGVGKTILAHRFIKKLGLQSWEIELPIQPEDITPVEQKLKNWLYPDFKDEIEPEFGTMLEKLKDKLKTKKKCVLIDNFESALNGQGKFIADHRRYLELLRVLANPDVQSVTLITSREPLKESKVTVEAYQLSGLDQEAWQDFLCSQNIKTNSPAFIDMHTAYGGNTKAMQILSGAIKQEPYEGDLEAYWQENKEDLLIETDLEDLVSSQFKRLKQTDTEAYKLLCRLGIYRYQQYSQVPSVALICLLWDVPEEKRRKVIKTLQDRFLVESQKDSFGKIRYWLHPVIRQEAISRLKQNCEWESANGRAIKFWEIYYSHILKTEQLEINKIDVNFNLIENYQEKLDLIIDTAEAIANYNIYKDELVVIEFIHHYLEFSNLDSLEELILQSNISENTGFSLLREKISEFVEWRINLGKSLYQLGEPTHTLAIIDKKEGNFLESEKEFTYYKRCFHVSQRFLKTALDIANQLKLYRLLNEAQLLLARFQYYSID
jgi:transcriptional regulator with XRE-family HTH domain